MKAASAQMGFQCPDVIVDGEVIEVDPPRKLVQTWRMLMDPTAAAEGFSRLSYEIEGPGADGVCRLTVTHELAGMTTLFAMTSGDNEFGAMGGGGWPWVLRDLKTLLETGEGFRRWAPWLPAGGPASGCEGTQAPLGSGFLIVAQA